MEELSELEKKIIAEFHSPERIKCRARAWLEQPDSFFSDDPAEAKRIKDELRDIAAGKQPIAASKSSSG